MPWLTWWRGTYERVSAGGQRRGAEVDSLQLFYVWRTHPPTVRTPFIGCIRGKISQVVTRPQMMVKSCLWAKRQFTFMTSQVGGGGGQLYIQGGRSGGNVLDAAEEAQQHQVTETTFKTNSIRLILVWTVQGRQEQKHWNICGKMKKEMN